LERRPLHLGLILGLDDSDDFEHECDDFKKEKNCLIRLQKEKILFFLLNALYIKCTRNVHVYR
jgi:hypothetical protein